jgi:Ca-activated chloride channel homolog
LAQATPLNDAATALDADLVSVTADRGDVTAIARRLARADRFSGVAGEGERWRVAGYWLTPLFGLLVLAGFRRGWVVPG